MVVSGIRADRVIMQSSATDDGSSGVFRMRAVGMEAGIPVSWFPI